MQANTILETISLDALDNVTGGSSFTAPLGGAVKQNINTNWGGSQTNINTQIVNPPPPPAPTGMVEYARTHPEFRYQQMQHRPVGRY